MSSRAASLVLEAAQGLAEGRCVAPFVPRTAERTGQSRADRLVEGQLGFGYGSCQKGGTRTGPNPLDRGRPGSKRHVVTDASGMPLAIALTGAHVHDSKVFEDLIDSIPPVKGKSGRPRSRPDKLHADKTYDYPRCRRLLRKAGAQGPVTRR